MRPSSLFSGSDACRVRRAIADDWRYVADVTIRRCKLLMLQPDSTKWAASQSSNSGWVGGSLRMPKSLGVRTDRLAEQVSPDAIDHDAGRQRVLRISDGPGHFQPAAAVGERLTVRGRRPLPGTAAAPAARDCSGCHGRRQPAGWACLPSAPSPLPGPTGDFAFHSSTLRMRAARSSRSLRLTTRAKHLFVPVEWTAGPRRPRTPCRRPASSARRRTILQTSVNAVNFAFFNDATTAWMAVPLPVGDDSRTLSTNSVRDRRQGAKR